MSNVNINCACLIVKLVAFRISFLYIESMKLWSLIKNKSSSFLNLCYLFHKSKVSKGLGIWYYSLYKVTFVLRTGKRIPSLLNISYFLLASLISRLAPLWQHRSGLSMGCQHRDYLNWTVSTTYLFFKQEFRRKNLKSKFSDINQTLSPLYFWRKGKMTAYFTFLQRT